MKKLILFTSILSILGLAVACSLSPVITSSTSNQQPPVEDTDASADQPADQNPDTPADLPAESVFGPGTFSLDLPAGWDVSGPLPVADESGRSYQIYVLGEDPTGQDGPGLSKVVVANAVEWTAQDLALMQCSTCPDNGFEEVTLGGHPALRTEIGGGGVPFMVTWYYVENGDNLIGIAIHDPVTLEPLTDVIESIQFQ